MERAFIYGDSLLKATMPDADMRYHFHLPEVMARYPSDRLEVVSRAKMGATVTKGLALVEHDVQRGMDARWPSPPSQSRSICPTQCCRNSWKSCAAPCRPCPTPVCSRC